MKKVNNDVFTRLADVMHDGAGVNLYDMAQAEALEHILNYILTLEYTVERLFLKKQKDTSKGRNKNSKATR